MGKGKAQKPIENVSTSTRYVKLHLIRNQIGDAKQYEPDYEGCKALDDANEMKAILNAILSGDDDLIKELTTGKVGIGEVSDDFVIE